MKFKLNIGYLAVVFLFSSITKSKGFALLGPPEPWMQSSNSVIYPSYFGGPMALTNEYRWNVPVVTYGFDKAFLDHFGTNGVAAVESAIQILNVLPPSSELQLTNFPFNSKQRNYVAQSLNICDLKSETLGALLGQLGLASPSRSMFVIRQWNPALVDFPNESQWPAGTIPNNIEQRNFDPQTLMISSVINGRQYTGYIHVFRSNNSVHYIDLIPPDPFSEPYTTVADDYLDFGEYYLGLTADDIGGLAYLFATNNVNFENLLSDVSSAAGNSNPLVKGAWRPGIDKISFIPHSVDPQSGAFLTVTNFYTDHYFTTNGILESQQLKRRISRPDFLFTAEDVTFGVPAFPLLESLTATNWINNAAANGNTNGAGPGIIQPQVQIVFNRLGRQFQSTGRISDEIAFDSSTFIGSFDGSTNEPVIYPIPQTGTNELTVRLWISFDQNFSKNFDWKFTSSAGTSYVMQTSTDMIHWITLFTAVNDNQVWIYICSELTAPNRFYRVVPQ